MIVCIGTVIPPIMRQVRAALLFNEGPTAKLRATEVGFMGDPANLAAFRGSRKFKERLRNKLEDLHIPAGIAMGRRVIQTPRIIVFLMDNHYYRTEIY